MIGEPPAPTTQAEHVATARREASTMAAALAGAAGYDEGAGYEACPFTNRGEPLLAAAWRQYWLERRKYRRRSPAADLFDLAKEN